jgi:hypothetical protein
MLQFARPESIDYLCFTQQEASTGDSAAVKLVILPSALGVTIETTIFDMFINGCKAYEIAGKLNMPVEEVKINIRKGMKLKANRT